MFWLSVPTEVPLGDRHGGQAVLSPQDLPSAVPPGPAVVSRPSSWGQLSAWVLSQETPGWVVGLGESGPSPQRCWTCSQTRPSLGSFESRAPRASQAAPARPHPPGVWELPWSSAGHPGWELPWSSAGHPSYNLREEKRSRRRGVFPGCYPVGELLEVQGRGTSNGPTAAQPPSLPQCTGLPCPCSVASHE